MLAETIIRTFVLFVSLTHATAPSDPALSSRDNGDVTQANESPRSSSPHGVQGCHALSKAKDLQNTIYPKGSDVYRYENADFWSLTEILSPTCVFRPTTAAQIGSAVEILTQTNTQFAVRGGGHMGIKVPLPLRSD